MVHVMRVGKTSLLGAATLAFALAAVPDASAKKGDGMWAQGLDTTFVAADFVDTEPYVQKAVDDICKGAQIQPNFVLKAVRGGKFDNALAIMENKQQRVIIYGTDYMRRLTEKGERYWEAYVTLAHEIGHHLNADPLDENGSSPKPELNADFFAGAAVKRAGGTLANAQSIYNRMAPIEGSVTHPPRRARLSFVKAGWDAAASGVERYDAITHVAAPEVMKKRGIQYVPSVATFIAGKIPTSREGIYKRWSEYRENGDLFAAAEWREVAREGTKIFLYDFERRMWAKIEPSPTGGGLAEAFWSDTGAAPGKPIYDANGGKWNALDLGNWK